MVLNFLFLKPSIDSLGACPHQPAPPAPPALPNLALASVTQGLAPNRRASAAGDLHDPELRAELRRGHELLRAQMRAEAQQLPMQRPDADKGFFSEARARQQEVSDAVSEVFRSFEKFQVKVICKDQGARTAQTVCCTSQGFVHRKVGRGSSLFGSLGEGPGPCLFCCDSHCDESLFILFGVIVSVCLS